MGRKKKYISRCSVLSWSPSIAVDGLSVDNQINIFTDALVIQLSILMATFQVNLG